MPPEHPGLLVPAGDVEGDGVEALVGPGDGQELLPPPRGHVPEHRIQYYYNRTQYCHVRDVEAEHEGQRDEVEECIEVFHYAFKQPVTRLV